MKCLAAIILCALSLAAQTDKEAALGRHLAAEYHPIDNPLLQSFVERLAKKLTSRSLTVGVIVEDGCREAVSLPGGYIFVPVQLFLTAKDEAEFVRGMAHAVAHGIPQRFNKDGIPLTFVGGCLGAPRNVETKIDTEAAKILTDAALDQIAVSSEEFVAARQEAQRLIQRRTQPPSLYRQ